LSLQENVKANILIVDDDILIAESNKVLIKKYGYKIAGIAANCPEAISLAKEKQPDLILMDINLGSKMDGITAAEEIQKFADIPIIFLTAYSDPVTLERAKKIGPFGYLIKPFDNRELIITIENSIVKHSFEKKTKEQELLFRTIANYAYEWELWLTPDLQFKFCSPSCKRISGYTSEEFLANPKLLSEIIHPEDKDAYEKHVEANYRHELNDVVKDFEFRIIDKDSNIKYISHTCSAIYDDKKSFLGRRVTNVDVTERKLAQEALRKSEETFRELYEKSPIGYQSLDENGNFLMVNEMWLKTLGYSEKDVIGKWFGDFLAPEFVEPFKKRFAHFKEQGKVHSEFYMIKKDGSRAYITFEGRIARNPDGEFKQTHCVLSDITEQKLYTDALKKSEDRFKQITESSGTWVWEVDTNGVYTYASHMSKNLLGYTPDEIIGKKYFYDFFEPNCKEELKRSAFKVFDQKKNFKNFENTNVHKDGHLVILETTGFPMFDERGNLIGYRGADKDITERKLAEQALRDSVKNFSLIFENSPLGIYVANSDGSIIDANMALLKILDSPSIEATKQINVLKFSALIANGYADKFRECVQKNEVIFFENKFTSNWGKTSYLSSYLIPLADEGGNVSKVYTLMEDITERKNFEKALNDSVRNYKEIFNSTNEAIFIHDAATGEILEVNDSMLKMYGYDNKETLLKNVDDFWLKEEPYSKQSSFVYIRKTINEGPQTFEWLARKNNGERFWVEVSLRETEIGGNGRILAVVRDITERKKIENTLKQQKDEFESIFNLVPAQIWYKDTKNNFIRVNNQVCESLGLTHAAIEGKSAEEIFPEFAKQYFEDDLQVIKSGKPKLGINEQIKTASGEIRDLHTDKIPVFNENGEVKGLIAFVLDITERKKAERELNESKEKWESLFNNSPNAIAVYKAVDDGKDFIFTDFNLTAQKVDNITREDVIGKRISELFPGAGALGFLELFRKVWQTGKTEFIKASLYKDDRIEGWRENIIYKLNTGEIVAIYNDVTERMKAELALRESEEKFRSIFENHSAIKLIIDPDTGNIIDANQAASDFYGWSIEELKRKKIQQINILPQAKVFEIMQSIKNKNHYHFELQHRIKDGTVKDMEIFSSKIEINGKTYLHSINHDITDRKIAERELKNYREHLEELVETRTEELDHLNSDLIVQLQKRKELEMMLRESLEKEKELNELKTRFISTASHEFRTPLTSILSSAELIQRYGKKWSEEKYNTHIDKIKTSVEYLTKLMEDVLTISRSESGKIMFKPSTFDLHKFCADIIEEIKTNLKDNHELVFKYSMRKKIFSLDPQLLKFTITNLLSNAVKYSPDGGKIKFIVESIKNSIKISVSDQGIGIPDEDKKHLFEPFHRSANTNEIPGTGLGLSIVKHAVDLHSGKIKVNSKLGEGTTFTIEIPKQQKEKKT
jgi:PAS domain S-box-containing protein